MILLGVVNLSSNSLNISAVVFLSALLITTNLACTARVRVHVTGHSGGGDEQIPSALVLGLEKDVI